MKNGITFLLFFLLTAKGLLYTQSIKKNKLSFLHTSGQDIVNESGEKIFLKGVGLGNWLLPEGYMWKFGSLGDRPRKIEIIVTDLIGNEKAALFWKTYRQNYITEADIRRISELGFNSVRPALNSRLFLSEGENPEYIDEGFQLIDSLVTWCKKHNLYVILDMHGAPGGQTGANIDDSPNNVPGLFIEQKHQDQLVRLWVKIASRYKGEPNVAAYDLLNEPLPVNTGAADKYKHLLVPLYRRLIDSIRKVDTRHMITVEGYDWSNDWSLFDKPLDKNTFYQFHYYCWARPDNLNSIDKFLKKRDELNTPIWVGETGEKGNAIYWTTTQLFEAKNIGFSFWPWKKMDTQNTPYSIKEPANWALLSSYTSDGPKPEAAVAESMLNELLENIKIEQCVCYEDVCNAILTRVPAKIEAENFGHNGFNRSYFVSDTISKSKFYRTSEPVKINLDSKKKDQFWSEQSIELQQTEWVTYTFESLTDRMYKLSLRASIVNEPAQLTIFINDKKLNVTVTNKIFKELTIGSHHLTKGKNIIKLLAKTNALKIDWIKCN